MNLKRRTVLTRTLALAGAAQGLLAGTAAAASSNWPAKPVRIIVP